MERYNQLAQEMGQDHLAEGGLLRLEVNGSSMEPTLLPGDVIWVEPVEADELSPGELVLARRAGDMVTHRLISSGEIGWVLKGDACPFPDPPLPAEALIGRAVRLERQGRAIWLNSAEMKSAGSRLLRQGEVETRIYLLSQQISRRIFGAKTPDWVKRVGRLVAAPVKRLIRLM